MSVTLDQKLVVLAKIYPFNPRRVLNGEVVLFSEENINEVLDYSHVNFEEEYLELKLEMAKNAKKAYVNVERDKIIDAGMAYEVQGTSDHVATKKDDLTILIGMNIKAMKAAAVTGDPVIEFRSRSNKNYMLTPHEAIDLTEKASEFVEGVYALSWQLKDQIDQCTTVEEVELIVWGGSV